MTEKRFTFDRDTVAPNIKTPIVFKEGERLSIGEVLDKLNELNEEKEQLLSDKEHLMGCLIRLFGYDDEDIDYNLNRESNREYGKQYYSMKEETKKELEE